MAEPAVFIDPSGTTTTSVGAATLGHVRRECNTCHAEWTLGQEHCRCGSHVFDEVHVPSTLLERIGYKIRGVATPEKPKARRVPAELVSELRGFQVTTERYRAELARIDGLLSAAVRDGGVDELLSVHGLLHQATFISGDRSSRNIEGLSLGLESIDACLGAEITRLEDTPK